MFLIDQLSLFALAKEIPPKLPSKQIPLNQQRATLDNFVFGRRRNRARVVPNAIVQVLRTRFAHRELLLNVTKPGRRS